MSHTIVDMGCWSVKLSPNPCIVVFEVGNVLSYRGEDISSLFSVEANFPIVLLIISNKVESLTNNISASISDDLWSVQICFLTLVREVRMGKIDELLEWAVGHEVVITSYF